jgi:hypothetical protein
MIYHGEKSDFTEFKKKMSRLVNDVNLSNKTLQSHSYSKTSIELDY